MDRDQTRKTYGGVVGFSNCRSSFTVTLGRGRRLESDDTLRPEGRLLKVDFRMDWIFEVT